MKNKLLLGTCIVLATFAMTACNTKKEEPVESETKRKIANVANSEENNLSKEPFALNYLKVQDNAPVETTFKDITIDKNGYTLSCKANVKANKQVFSVGRISAFQNGIELENNEDSSCLFAYDTGDEEEFNLSYVLEDLSDVTIVVMGSSDNWSVIEIPIETRSEAPGEPVSGIEYIEHGVSVSGGKELGFVDFKFTNTTDKITSPAYYYSFYIYQNGNIISHYVDDTSKKIFPGYTGTFRITYDLPYNSSGLKFVVTDESSFSGNKDSKGNIVCEIPLD